MHSKSNSNPSSSPVKDPASLKRSKQQNMSSETKNQLQSDECFWNITKSSNHPVIVTKINRLRRKDTDSKLYRELMYEIGTFLAYEATSDLSLTEPKTVKICCFLEQKGSYLILFAFLGSRC